MRVVTALTLELRLNKMACGKPAPPHLFAIEYLRPTGFFYVSTSLHILHY